MKKTIIKVVSFILILCVVLNIANNVFKFKYGDGIYNVTKFYDQEDNTVDVLFLGSSHIFENLNTGTLWDEYGISSYILGGSVQPLWNSYHYLKEALKTQKPELIVLEGFMTTWYQDYIDDSRIIKNNYGLKPSLNKVEAIMTSSPKERWSEFLLEYTQYHNRYKELSAADFLPNQNCRLYDDWKGYGLNTFTTELTSVDVSDITKRTPLYDKCEKYYRMILELAKDNNIPILVVISPYAGISETDKELFNTASDIAKEYDVNFVDFNSYVDEMELDYKTDVADVAHMNYKGSQKYASYLGNYIKSNYEIPDHRNDDKYDSWQRNADYIRQVIYNQQFVNNIDINSLGTLLNNSNYWISISLDGKYDQNDTTILKLLNSLNITDTDYKGIYLIQNNILTYKSNGVTSERYIRTDTHDFLFSTTLNDKNEIINNVIIDNSQYKKVTNGINVVVYDTVTEQIIDSFGINVDDNYSIVR